MRDPDADGAVNLEWRKNDGKLEYRLEMPAGYQAAVTNRSGLPLVEKKR